MPSLRELQRTVRAALFAGDERGACALVRGDGVAPARRLAAYRNNVWHNYTEALRAVYPVVERLVGEEFFAFAARRYIGAHPSVSGDLHDYGCHFGPFLDAFPPAASVPYLGDVARLEWLWHECFHAADHAPLAIERLGEVPPQALEGLCLILHPACRLLASRYPVDRIWAVNQPSWQGDTAVSLDDGGASVLLRRDGYEVELEPLTAGEFAMLHALSTGERLAAASAAASAADRGFDLAAFLQRQVCRAVIVDFAFDPA